jgi:hypothetical protein
MSVVVVVPSRGRPAAARKTLAAIRDTAALVSTAVIIAVDADDPKLEAYLAFGRQEWLETGLYSVECSVIVLQPDETGSLVQATNTIAKRIVDEDPGAIVGNLGDDHRPRTSGWDARIAAALEQPGVAYGDDLIHGERLPSAPFVSGSIVAALGWYFLPQLEHMYVDDAWRELAAAAGVLRYLPDVVIEHMHPDVGKGDWDDLYRRVNADEAVARDRGMFEAWLGSPYFAGAVATVQAAL